MGEVMFYHQTTWPLERILPELLTRSLERGWRVVLRAGDAAHLNTLDEMLWTCGDDSFLPHGTADMGHAESQPVYLTLGRENPAGANILMLAAGARVDPTEVQGFDRVCLIFDGNEPDALAAARADWMTIRDAGLHATYYSQEEGNWKSKAATGG